MSKKYFGPQSIENRLSELLKPIFQSSKKEFILINNLVRNWEEIAGKKYAAMCYPKSVSINKDKLSGGKLTIAVYNSAVGFFLENNSELLTERIAKLYGHKAISNIIIKQEPKITKVAVTTETKLPEHEEKNLQEKIAKVSDADLAETLQKLGRDILKDKRNEQSK